MMRLLGLRDVFLRLASDHNLSAIALESFMSIPQELGVSVGFSMALAYEHGIPICHETDIHGAISSIMIEAAGLNKRPSFLADLTIRHPENDNGVLLWHDAFPLSLRDPAGRALLGGHWIISDIGQGMTHWKLAEGEVTICRFEGERGCYRLTAAPARSIPGPFTQNNYLWVEVADWPAMERHFIEGPYMHHVACAYGNHVSALRESCRFIEGLEFDPVPGQWNEMD
jgi:L-fucose isomerase-like protein